MDGAARSARLLAVLALVFAVTWTAGAAGRVPDPPPPAADVAPVLPATVDDRRTPDAGALAVRGLAATAAGYALVPHATTFTPGKAGEFAFTVTGPGGRPVTAFAVVHGHPMHLVVVRRDAAGYQRLHPTLGADGGWRVPLVLPAAGVYRVYADFVPVGGPPLVLGTDVFAPGHFAPIEFAPSRVAQVDGYQVRLDGELVAGAASQVFATISRGDAPVTDLEPHLGAFGHLVALRRTDLAYLHAHPAAAPPSPAAQAGPGIAFPVEVPSPGHYRLFLEFRHGGTVRTAEFTVDTRDGA
ncbi:hypothetical protein [Pseudonocardia nigra]|uniref:hypothetical protein n=1 Tax=Pseudonocardia nigra TaxID=1921578 RepID=UPI001C5FE15E|nr:hypothetical protein [Pseudonocardia nigra]